MTGMELARSGMAHHSARTPDRNLADDYVIADLVCPAGPSAAVAMRANWTDHNYPVV